MIHHVSVGTNDVPSGARVLRSADGVDRLSDSQILGPRRSLRRLRYRLQPRNAGERRARQRGQRRRISPSRRPTGETVRRFHGAALANGGRDEERRVSANSTAPTTMEPSCAIPTATRSKP